MTDTSWKIASRGCAISAVALGLVLLATGASQAGWLSDLFKGKKPEHAQSTQKTHAASKPAASRPNHVSKREERSSSRSAEKSQTEKSTPVKLRTASIGAAACEPAKFHLVVDVGHTRKSDGALSARNVPEYEFNLKLATRLVEKLKSDGFTGARLMVTEGKARPSLFQRVAAANRMNADLFLSIHHDSVPDKFLEDWEFEGKKSKFSDHFGGWAVFVSHDNAHYDASLAFAKLIGAGLKEQNLKFADQYTLPVMGRYRRDLVDSKTGVYRYDNLIVLEKTAMPAVLLEAGSISNRDEELQMGSAERQDVIIGAVAAAVKDYCDPALAPLQANADRK